MAGAAAIHPKERTFDLNKRPVRKILQGPLMYLLMLAVILLVVHMLTDGTAAQPKSISYSTLLEWVEADLRNSLGEKLSDEQQGMTLSKVVIQSNTLSGVTEENVPIEVCVVWSVIFDSKCVTQ